MKRAQSNHVIRWDSAGSKRGKNSQAYYDQNWTNQLCKVGHEASWLQEQLENIGRNRPFSLVDFVFPIQVMWRFLGGLNLCRILLQRLRAKTLKESTLQGIVAWSVLGTQNRQAKKVYYNNQSSPNVSFVVQPFLWWLIASKIQPHCSKWKWM